MITGLHGLHVIIGMSLLAISFALVAANKINADRFTIIDDELVQMALEAPDGWINLLCPL